MGKGDLVEPLHLAGYGHLLVYHDMRTGRGCLRDPRAPAGEAGWYRTPWLKQILEPLLPAAGTRIDGQEVLANYGMLQVHRPPEGVAATK
jgi:hypothetical protein